jgi:hypothetical protein
MSIRDEFFQSSRSKEDKHFRRQDSEWIKKMQKEAELEVERRPMAEAIGAADPKILQELQELGYTEDTVKVLYLVPLVHVAWIEGHVTHRERKRILLEIAQSQGIEEGSLAYSRLTEWLTQRPHQRFFERTLSVIRDLLKALPVEQGQVIKKDLLSGCTHVAAASGGLLGLGQTISDAEQALLKHIVGELEGPQDAAAKQPEAS